MELAEEQSKWLRRVTSSWRRVADLFFPRYCVGCGRRLMESERTLCLHCRLSLPRTNLWLRPGDNTLAKLYWGRTEDVEIEKAVAFLDYAPQSMVGRIVHDFKYHGRKYLATEMGAMMADELLHTDIFEGIDCMVPVPVTMGRFLQRGYNQVDYLARGIAKVTGLPVERRVLKRIHFSGSQTSLSGVERDENVKGAFALREKEAERLRGRHLLLLDDVVTTSATTRECCKVLARIPGVRISLLAFSTVQSGIIRREFSELKIEN